MFALPLLTGRSAWALDTKAGVFFALSVLADTTVGAGQIKARIGLAFAVGAALEVCALDARTRIWNALVVFAPFTRGAYIGLAHGNTRPCLTILIRATRHACARIGGTGPAFADLPVGTTQAEAVVFYAFSGFTDLLSRASDTDARINALAAFAHQIAWTGDVVAGRGKADALSTLKASGALSIATKAATQPFDTAFACWTSRVVVDLSVAIVVCAVADLGGRFGRIASLPRTVDAKLLAVATNARTIA